MGSSIGWMKATLRLEIKKRAIYPVDFWMKMLIPPVVQLLVGYYLWDAIYAGTQDSMMGGFSLLGMILYSFVAASVYQMVQPEVGIFLMEIYHGTLTKYLVYPFPIFTFKFLAHLAQMSLILVQLIITVTLLLLYSGVPAELHIEPWSCIVAIAGLFLAGYLYFIMASMLELLGFWVETVWGLVIMLQFVTHLLGGKLIPLSLFPTWGQEALLWLPFRYMVSFPTEIFFGNLIGGSIPFGFGIGLLWSIVFTIVAKYTWRVGSFHYSGTGM